MGEEITIETEDNKLTKGQIKRRRNNLPLKIQRLSKITALAKREFLRRQISISTARINPRTAGCKCIRATVFWDTDAYSLADGSFCRAYNLQL
jgi:hypothetical protein